MDESNVQKLRTNAARCRRLADAATNPEAAHVLRALAADIETAIPILQAHAGRAAAPASNDE
jgi:hypothetical protein